MSTSLLSNLKLSKGSRTSPKRVGRGRGSGLGQTAGKGHKGQLARSGGKVRRGFEGGQTPLIRRLPKFGFSNLKFETVYSVVNLADLNKFEGTVDLATLQKAGLVKEGPVKVLGMGELKKKLTVKLDKYSEKAKSEIQKLGGIAEEVK